MSSFVVLDAVSVASDTFDRSQLASGDLQFFQVVNTAPEARPLVEAHRVEAPRNTMSIIACAVFGEP